jgi:general secretion pathway protein G
MSRNQGAGVAQGRRRALTLLELLAVVTIIAILASLVMPRLSGHAAQAKVEVDLQYQADLNSAIERYYFDQGNWPADVDALYPDYYPDALPVCPFCQQPYAIDAQTQRIVPHQHL